MANVLFKRGSTATINSTAITDGQLLYDTTTGQQYIDSGSARKEVGKPVDTTLSTTSTNAIANNALTNSIINTTAEVSAITADNIPCGTKPVKELITSLSGIKTMYKFVSLTLSNQAQKSVGTLESLTNNKVTNSNIVGINALDSSGAGLNLSAYLASDTVMVSAGSIYTFDSLAVSIMFYYI